MKASSAAIWPLLRMCCTDRPSHTLQALPLAAAEGKIPGEAQTAIPKPSDLRGNRTPAEMIDFAYVQTMPN